MDQPFVRGSVQTPAGETPRVESALSRADRLGAILVRSRIRRMNYTVDPGLYALGDPSPESPVLISANYKLSFDHLRRSLDQTNAWILVLDTDGINVWCAAGKGTFGTDELVKRIKAGNLEQVVSHRQIIVPQLGGPGVAAHLVKRHSGFEVLYGPVRADELPAFLAAGNRATPEMRRVSFDFGQRAAVVPVELMGALKHMMWLAPLVYLLGGLWGPQPFWQAAAQHGMLAAQALLIATLAGAAASPLLLPWLPGRAFSLKGMWPGLLGACLLALAWLDPAESLGHHLEIAAWMLLTITLSSFLAMNFTGASTYTSLSGVIKEMRRAVPLQIGAGVLGLALWAASFFIA